MSDLRKMLDDSEEVWVDDAQLKKDTQSYNHSLTMKNRISPNRGKKFGPASEETKEKNRQAHLDRDTTPEWAENISKAKSNIPQSPEHIAALKAQRNTPEARLKRSKSLSNGTYVTPLGTFESRLMMFIAYEGQPITHDRLVKWSKAGVKGFSFIPKD